MINMGDNLSRKFISDYSTLRSSIKDNFKFGIWAFLKERKDRSDIYIKNTLCDLFTVNNSRRQLEGRGRKNKQLELLDDRYLFANNIESILTLSSFKPEDLVTVRNIIHYIDVGMAVKDITDLIHGRGSAVKDFCNDHRMSIVKIGKTKATKYSLNDVLDLSEEERIRLHNALFIARHFEPLTVPAWFIAEKLRAAVSDKDALLDNDDIILQYDVSEHVYEAPLIWTFLRAVWEDKGISMNFSKGENEQFQASSAELVFNDMNGKVYLNTYLSEHEINTITDISIIKESSSDTVREKKTNRILKFSDMGYRIDELKEMFGDKNVGSDMDGMISIRCENYKKLKPFIRKNHTTFIPDDAGIRNELKADCLAALENYGETI